MAGRATFLATLLAAGLMAAGSVAVPNRLFAEGNPFGVAAPKSTSPTAGVPAPFVQSLKDAGVAYLRPTEVGVEEWIQSGGRCHDCFQLRNCGVALTLTLRNSGKKSGKPSTPPKDLSAYQQAVAQILENYRPSLIAIETEEDGGVHFSDAPGAEKEYAKQLSVACEEAQKRNMRCTNGGLTQQAAAMLTWFQYLSLGQKAKACDYAKRALAEPGKPASAEKYCKIPSAAQLPEKMRKQIERGRTMIQIYRGSPIDFVNLHWLGDAAALKETVDFLKIATGKNVMSNELRLGGTKDGTPLMLAVKEKNFSYAVWHNSDRPSDKAIQAFLKENYP